MGSKKLLLGLLVLMVKRITTTTKMGDIKQINNYRNLNLIMTEHRIFGEGYMSIVRLGKQSNYL